MPSLEVQPEKPVVESTAMEITVNRQLLLRELTATQGVVERKTTIPILSNFLLEADQDRLTIGPVEVRDPVGSVLLTVDGGVCRRMGEVRNGH